MKNAGNSMKNSMKNHVKIRVKRCKTHEKSRVKPIVDPPTAHRSDEELRRRRSLLPWLRRSEVQSFSTKVGGVWMGLKKRKRSIFLGVVFD